MAKKLKDYYDTDYVLMLVGKLEEAGAPAFDYDAFLTRTTGTIEGLAFGARQILVAEALKDTIDAPYEDVLKIFSKILGPELRGNAGNFNHGWWLWPIGTYVELYGADAFEATTAFSKELTKRFTSEYCMRPLIAAHPERAMALLVEWSLDPHERVRRLASECVRIRLPWSKKLDVALDRFDEYVTILSNLRHDTDKYIQKSVGNNLNDLWKEAPERFEAIVRQWEAEPMSKATEWIIKHGSRNIEGES